VARARHLARPTGRPIIAQYTDVDADAYTILPDGRKMGRTVFGLTEEQIGRVQAGYVCVKCLEDHDAPFPDACSVCKFPMRDHQMEEFAKDYRGGIRFGPSTSLDGEYEIAEEQIAREAHDKARDLGLILPKWY